MPDYGLSVKQMQVLGLTNDAAAYAARLPEVRAVSVARPRSAVGRLCAGCGGQAGRGL